MIESLKIYEGTLNFTNIKCPYCHSTNLIKYGTYDRNVIYEEDEEIKSDIIKIQRFMCKSCNTTHAILPDFLVPYKQYSIDLLLIILLELILISAEELSMKYKIHISNIKRFKKQFNQIHKIKLITTFASKNINETLQKLYDDVSFNIKYIKENNQTFMQIRLLSLGLCPF